MLLKEDKSIQPGSGVLYTLSDDQRLKVQLVVSLVLDAFDGGDWPLARQHWEEADLDTDERVACWGFFSDSKQRAYLKREDRRYLQDDA